MMERRNFLKSTLIATGGLLLGATAIHRLLNDKEPAEGWPKSNKGMMLSNLTGVIVAYFFIYIVRRPTYFL